MVRAAALARIKAKKEARKKADPAYGYRYR